MEIRIELNSYDDLKRMSWCNEDNWNKIERYSLEDEYFSHIECMMEGISPTDTEVNDELRFGDLEEWILEVLDLDYVDNIEDLQEIANDLYASGAEEVINDAIDANKGEKLWEYIHEQFNGSTSLQDVFEFIESDVDLEDLE